ncbi:DUF6624 domain-containing protein [Mucilaginibacter polytrichastri]|uniref:Uncharacterized protein n=1 Tax=Mucilaginibacter polytrichastri TaxID=1302689 RepID=A0A1Q6A344_9SPHI|nr:DUF6624 domain-containing protein [Mucilaginibacter polytrichastri]OKS88411.1 hypothetical protein RG47T_3878 [Mucilaginibacter polytrichastri]SFT14358.1 hypothetical protein SAMN04487890_112140 [Mucilaginibacter polytrichastri]
MLTNSVKLIILGVCFCALSFTANAQNFPIQYHRYIHKADSLYQAKNYQASGMAYSNGFKVAKGKGTYTDRYNAACSWALANVPDSAFASLEYLVKKLDYSNSNHLFRDMDMMSLFSDKRWLPLLKRVNGNRIVAEAGYNMPLVKELDTIYRDDQNSRLKLDSVQKKFGINSKELNDLWAAINSKDSVNLIKVEAILDQYGWLGPDIIGRAGNMTLFLVIQHADKDTRTKYLPMMREAVKKGQAEAPDLALMEDRAALEAGNKQLYGSQIGQDTKTGKYYIDPIEDEPNVNNRRAAVGLAPLEYYVQQWGIVYKVPNPKGTGKKVK